MDIFQKLKAEKEKSEKFLRDYAESEKIVAESDAIKSQIKELEAKLEANEKRLGLLLPAVPSVATLKQSRRAETTLSNILTSKQAENLKLIFQLMIAHPDKNTAKGISDDLKATMDNCSQANVNSLLNSALQLFPDLVTSAGKAAGRKVSLIQGVSLNDLTQAVDSKTKSKS